jgi:hypothetical protein
MRESKIRDELEIFHERCQPRSVNSYLNTNRGTPSQRARARTGSRNFITQTSVVLGSTSFCVAGTHGAGLSSEPEWPTGMSGTTNPWFAEGVITQAGSHVAQRR